MNRGFIASLIVTLSLTGCGAVQQAQLNAAASSAKQEVTKQCSLYLHLPPKEAEAWTRALDEMKGECSTSGKQPTKEQMPAVDACATKILNEEIKPITYSPQKFARYMASRAEDHTKYANGELSLSEMQAGMKRRLDKYTEKAPWSYYRYATCHNEVVTRKVLPTYQFKPLFMEYMNNLAAFARKADKEKMAREDFDIGAQRLWTDFARNEQGAIGEARAENAAGWKNASDTFQQMQATQALQRASMPPPRMPTTTDCRVIGGNTLNCTSY